MTRRLALLDARIADRSAATEVEHPWWPCRAGCDACCRSLGRAHRLTEPEWTRLLDAIGAFSPADRRRALARLAAMTDERPIVCPLLADGMCTVYAARPLGCRTHGFFADRDGVDACGSVTSAVEAHPDEPVTWGNGEAIARDAHGLGEARSIAEWARAAIVRS